MASGGSPLWRRDRNKIGPDGQPVRYPIIPGSDMNELPELDFPMRQPAQIDDDGGSGEWESYKIQLIYDDDSIEMIPIVAIDADDALNQALAQRDPERKHLKIKTSIVQDGVGEVLSQLVHGLEKGYTVGAKGYVAGRTLIGKAGRAGAQVVGDVAHVGAEVAGGIGIGAGRTAAVYSTVKRQAMIGRLERIFADIDDANPARRALARRELQTKFPQIYKHIGWRRV